MKRNGLYLIVGFGIWVAEVGALVTEVGNEIEHFALVQLQREKDRVVSARASVNSSSLETALAA